MPPRGPNILQTSPIPVSTNEKLEAFLQRIVQTGFYGKNSTEAAERLLAERVKDLFLSGEIDRLEALAKERKFGGSPEGR